jgi:hypothetical protein
MAGGTGTPLREILARFGFEVDDAKLQRADEGIGNFMGKLRQVAGILAGGAFVRGMTNLVSRAADVGSEIHDTAIALGVSSTSLQQWRYLAAQAGVEAGALSQGFGLLQKKALDAARGGEGAAMFRRLGVSVKNAAGELKDPATLFEEVGLAIRSHEQRDGADRHGPRVLRALGEAADPAVHRGRRGDPGDARRARGAGRRDEPGAGRPARSLRRPDEAAEPDLGGVQDPDRPEHPAAFERVVDWLVRAGKTVVRVANQSHILQAAMGVLGTAALAMGPPDAGRVGSAARRDRGHHPRRHAARRGHR